jgi:hypothetical protein
VSRKQSIFIIVGGICFRSGGSVPGAREVFFHAPRQLEIRKPRGARAIVFRARFDVGRGPSPCLELRKEEARAPNDCESRLDGSALPSMTFIQPTDEAPARVRPTFVNGTSALGSGVHQRGARLLEALRTGNHAQSVPPSGFDFFRCEVGATEKRPVATEPAGPTKQREIGFCRKGVVTHQRLSKRAPSASVGRGARRQKQARRPSRDPFDLPKLIAEIVGAIGIEPTTPTVSR